MKQENLRWSLYPLRWCGALMLVFAASTMLAGCSSSERASGSTKGDGKIVAVATVGMVADLVRRVGGEFVEVQQICGSGIDPHTHTPTRDDVQKFLAADIIFYNGLLLEGKMSDKLANLSKSKPVIAIADSIAKDRLLAPEEFEGHPDPHVWMDVSLYAETVDSVKEGLTRLNAEHQEAFAANAATLKSELSMLDDYVRQTLASIPQDARTLITSHDAFNYLGRAYDLKVEGVQGISTESEAGLRRINELVDRLVDQKIEAVFVESSVNPKNIQALIEGARSRGHVVENGGELFSDAMGSAGSYEGTYVGMIDHNATAIARALGGTAPDGGMQGKLSMPETAK